MNIFIDTENMEERYAEELYKDYLEEQNKQLQQERDKYKSIVEELKKYLKENLYFYSGYQGEDLEEDISIKYALDKIKELEEGNSNEC